MQGSATLGELDLEPRRRRPAGQPRQRHHRGRSRRSTPATTIDGRAALHVAPTVGRRLPRRGARRQGDHRRFARAARRRCPRLRRSRHREGRRRRADQRPQGGGRAGRPDRRPRPAQAAADARRAGAGDARRRPLPGPSWTIAARAASSCSTRRRSKAPRSTPARASAARSTARGRRSPWLAASAASIRIASAPCCGCRRLTEARLRGRIDATFDLAGSGTTVPTLEVAGRVGVPRAAIVGGEVRDAVADVRLTRGALDGTLAASFTNLDPGLAADRPPLAGAVTRHDRRGRWRRRRSRRSSLPDTTGRVTADAAAVAGRRAHRSIAARCRPRWPTASLDVASLDVAGPLADVTRARARSPSRARARRTCSIASSPPTWRRRRRWPGRRTSAAPGRSRARSRATSPSCTRPARWRCRTPPTARRRAPSTRRCAST